MTKLSALTLLAGIASLFGTILFTRHALRSGLLDRPNHRSSHTVPTPRGRGLAIIIPVCASLLASCALWPEQFRVWLVVAIATSLAAAVGFADDRGHVPRRFRLVVHVLAGIAVVVSLPRIPPLEFGAQQVVFGHAGSVLAAVYVVWMLNLVNFMDGIDGLAAAESVFVGAAGSLCTVAATGHDPLAPLSLPLAAASAGFLVLNWPPARVFMGDVGSGAIGTLLAAIALHAATQRPALFWCHAILLGVFIVDATGTLLHRLWRRERIYEAHRSHAYQHAAFEHRSHRVVSVGVAAINLLWLLPCALVVARGAAPGAVVLICAYAPLVWLLWRYRAGAAEPSIAR